MRIKCKNYKNGLCSYEEDGLCKNLSSKEDNLSLHCSGIWTKEKIDYLKYFSEIFSTGMKNKWSGNIFYIDLFCGPGKCIIRETLEEVDNTCFKVVNLKDKFKKYFLVDINKKCIIDLKKRLGENGIEYYNNDCNKVIDEIVETIPTTSLGLAVIDPDSLQFHFNSFEKLAQRKIDLIVNYPIVSIERAVSAVLKNNQNSKKLDSFHPEWKNIVSKKTWGCSKKQNIKNLINDYIQKIENLGYYSSELIPFKNGKNATLYYLIAFSKSPKGIEIWKKSSSGLKKKSGQQSLL